MARGQSLYGTDRECFICKSPYVECHHIYQGAIRPIADGEGCWVWLCHEHHQGLTGVHHDIRLKRFFKEDCQRRWERREGLEGEEAHEAFRRRFHQSYL